MANVTFSFDITIVLLYLFGWGVVMHVLASTRIAATRTLVRRKVNLRLESIFFPAPLVDLGVFKGFPPSSFRVNTGCWSFSLHQIFYMVAGHRLPILVTVAQ
jgi:hypothetical protein